MLDCCSPSGGVAEWLNATVLKTVDQQGFVGSNPTPSATILPDRSAWVPRRCIVYIMVRTRGPAPAYSGGKSGPVYRGELAESVEGARLLSE